MPDPNDVLNPERGLFTFVDLLAGAQLSGIRASGVSVVYSTMRLDAFLNAPLPDSFLAQVNAALDSVRAAHLKVLLRFAYNSPGQPPNPTNTQDASLAQIEMHLAQLTPVLRAQADVIVALEAGLIGQYGEWHDSSSNLTNRHDRHAVMAALLAAMPESRTILIRTPGAKRESWPGPVSASDAFSSLSQARIGHHNDCFLASANDLDTYLAADDAAYLATDTAFLPMAGETCALNPPRTTCAQALAELEAFHYDLLNSTYHPDVIASWVAEGCMPIIKRRLGYRLTLTRAALNTATSQAGAHLHLQTAVSNTGFGRLFNARPLYLSLQGPLGRFNYLLGDIDPRLWGPGVTHVVDVDVSLGAIPKGHYTAALWLPDAEPALQNLADYAVRFANVNMWDAALGYNVLTDAFVVQ